MGGIDAETSNNVQNSLNKHGALPILPVTCASTACGDGYISLTLICNISFYFDMCVLLIRFLYFA